MVAGEALDASIFGVYNDLEMLYYEVHMADIVDIADFKARKLAKLTAEWDECMSMAETLNEQGKLKFARELILKAKKLRDQLNALKKPEKPKATGRPAFETIYKTDPTITYNYEGLASVDWGHPKE
jgi:hypothetical protein